MPCHSVLVPQPAESATEDKKKGKVEKVKKCIRTAAGTTWEDQSMLEWETGNACVELINNHKHSLILIGIDIGNACSSQ